MKLHVVKRVMRVFCRAKYNKASTRPKKTLEAERIRERVRFARVFLVLHRLGLRFWYVDEYNVDQQPAKPYAWVEPQSTKQLVFKKMNCTAGNLAAVATVGLLHHEAFVGRTDSASFSRFLQNLVGRMEKQGDTDRSSTLLLVDQASYHVSKHTKQVIRDLGLRSLVSTWGKSLTCCILCRRSIRTVRSSSRANATYCSTSS